MRILSTYDFNVLPECDEQKPRVRDDVRKDVFVPEKNAAGSCTPLSRSTLRVPSCPPALAL